MLRYAKCTFDNPEKMRRECWCDGELIAWYSAKTIVNHSDDLEAAGIHTIDMYRGPWDPGLVRGEVSSLDRNTQIVALGCAERTTK